MQADPWDTLREPPRQLQREEHSSVEDLAGFLAGRRECVILRLVSRVLEAQEPG